MFENRQVQSLDMRPRPDFGHLPRFTYLWLGWVLMCPKSRFWTVRTFGHLHAFAELNKLMQ